MRLAGKVNRRRAVLLLLFLLVTCAAGEEGILVLQVVDAKHHPFAHVRIALAGEGGSPQDSDTNGRLRLRLAPNTKPFAWATLLLKGGPSGMELTFIQPYDEPARVRVPPFENDQDNYDEVVVVRDGDKDTLEHGSGRLAIEGASTAAQRSAPKSQYRPIFDGPRLLNVALRLGPPSRNENCASGEFPQVGLLAAARKVGLPVADIKAAIASWGGSSLAWKTMMMTASIEAGGTDPFLFVHATGNDILFGAGSSSLRGCSLQPMLVKLRERDPQLFVSIVGKEDDEWLSNALLASCDASSSMLRERMLEASGALRHSWREKFRVLGYEPTFQHVQVDEITRSLQQAQAQATALGMTSNQAAAYFAYVATQAGASMIPSQQQSFTQDVAAFKRQIGREPDEQEKLLLLANRIDARLKTVSPAFTPVFLAKAAFLSGREGTVLGRSYDLDEFGLGLTDSRTCGEIPVHGDKQILAKLALGWPSSQPSQPALQLPGYKECPGGSQLDSTADQQLVDLINHERTQRNIPPLQPDPHLTEAARQHSVQMAQHQTLSHQLPGEIPLEERYAALSLQSIFNGETLVTSDSVSSANHRLMNDPGHSAIILNPSFNSVGVGVLRCGGSLYVTEDFAQLQQNYSNDEAASAVADALATYATSHSLPAPLRRPQAQLQSLVCNLAQTHTLDAPALKGIPGVGNVVAWATANLKELPNNATTVVSQPLPAGYSLAACLAPGGIYWIVMITYDVNGAKVCSLGAETSRYSTVSPSPTDTYRSDISVRWPGSCRFRTCGCLSNTHPAA